MKPEQIWPGGQAAGKLRTTQMQEGTSMTSVPDDYVRDPPWLF